ncbi:flotillin family protein [Aquipuribacter sp. SD81]|uniref:flotillin family protein n=1 Tax=Aquipuribacter sp. SD81 TaxID=3127703 RepID=UPI00301B48C7
MPGADLDLGTLVPVTGLVVLVVLVVVVVVRRYKVAGPDQAFIVTGRRGSGAKVPGQADTSGQKVVLGGGVFVLPLVQKLHVLDMSSRRIPVQIRSAVSGQGIKLNVEGVAIVKVGGNEDSIRAAAQRFLSQQEDITPYTQEVLAGALRSIVGALSVEQIIRDRAAFAQRVADESENSLTGQGLVLDTFQIQDISDDGTYLADLGRPEAARVGQTAAVAEANARQEAEQARIRAEEQIAISNRALNLKQAEIKAEIDAAGAQAAAAGPLAQADRDQAILLEQEKVAVRQAALTERQLDTQVRKPADAERYRVEQEAEGRRNADIATAEARKAAAIAAAQAKAEETRLSGVAEQGRREALAQADAVEGAKRGEAEKARRVAIADAVRIEGESDAAAVLARGSAEAEAMERRAAAFSHYNDAAVLELLVQVLPRVARELAQPISAIDKLTVISTDGAGAIPRQVTDNLVQTMELLKGTTGIDLQDMMSRAAKGRDGSSAVTPAPAQAPASAGE